jgi:hypothetical protein
METTLYAVMYFGNAKRYQDLNYEIAAFTKREAVERFYAKMLNVNYFPVDEFDWGHIVNVFATWMAILLQDQETKQLNTTVVIFTLKK